MDMNMLFVYGTLKKGHGNHARFMSEAEYVGTGTTDAKWGLADLGAFPALTFGRLSVEGEVYRVTDSQLSEIDRLEGVAHGLYFRELIPINVNGEKVDCNTYIMLELHNYELSTRWD